MHCPWLLTVLLWWSANLQTKFIAIPINGLSCRHDRTFFTQRIVNNIQTIYQIPTKLGMRIVFHLLFICTKFKGNRVRTSCFITIFEKCVKWFWSKPPGAPWINVEIFWKFACSYLGYAYRDLPHIWNLSRGYLRCHSQRTYMGENCEFLVPVNMLTMLHPILSRFLGLHDKVMCVLIAQYV